MPKKRAACSALIKAAKEDRDEGVRFSAISALAYGFSSDDSLVIPAALQLAADKTRNQRERVAAIEVLGGLKGPVSVPSVPLLELLEDPDVSIRRAVINAFLSLPRRREVMPAVERLLKDSDESVRTQTKILIDRLKD